jgi:hypothetical protein
MGVGYQCNLDFVGPLGLNTWHNLYVLVMTEHFSKWIELAPLQNKSNKGVTYAFLD